MIYFYYGFKAEKNFLTVVESFKLFKVQILILLTFWNIIVLVNTASRSILLKLMILD